MMEDQEAKKACIAEYSNQLEGVIEELFAAASDAGAHGWANVHNKNGVAVDVQYKEGASLASARTKSIIKAPVEDVYRFTQSIEFLEDVDPLYIDGRVVESLDENHDILYSAYSCGFFLLSNRDFVYFEGRRHLEDGTKVVACFSVERDDVPPVKEYVRAHIYHSGWVVKPLEGDDGKQWCHATFCAQADPKGWIPHKLVNFFSGELAKTIYNIQEYLEKEKSGVISKKRKKKMKKTKPARDITSQDSEGIVADDNIDEDEEPANPRLKAIDGKKEEGKESS